MKIVFCLRKKKVFKIYKPEAHSRRLLLIMQDANGSRQTDLKAENINIHRSQKPTISGKYRSYVCHKKCNTCYF